MSKTSDLIDQINKSPLKDKISYNSVFTSLVSVPEKTKQNTEYSREDWSLPVVVFPFHGQ